ncbi:hypothetical protein [Aridibaculum aurantiacum]|uniref:hypothetical protein n=1 Tax=Aridibaculum aurantiacum TaxID=2810307 RepID=UPI001A977342|nr:hypothetical protein [Aridibaculum aurantiacum]
MYKAILKNLFVTLLVPGFSVFAQAQSPKVISEVSVVYELSIEDANADANTVKAMNGAVKNLFIKGSKVRTDLVTPSFKQVFLHDSKSDTTVVLRELGNTKYLTYIDARKRTEQNRKYEGITFINTEETKTILGYECKKIVARLKDGSQYNVFYAPSIIPSNRSFEYQFQDLPGFALEYEAQSEDGKTRVKYTATRITLTPVPVALFDIPRSGYRIL